MQTEAVAPNTTSPRSWLQGATMFLAGALVAALLVGSVAFAAHDTNTIHACAQNTTGDLRVVAGDDQCRPQERAIQWNVQGPAVPAEIPDGAIGTRHLAPDTEGVSAAGLSFSGDGELQGLFNRFGGPPSVELIEEGADRQAAFRQFRVLLPGLEAPVARGAPIVTVSVEGFEPEPMFTSHRRNADGSIDVFLWLGGDPEEAPGKIVIHLKMSLVPCPDPPGDCIYIPPEDD